MIDMLLRTYEQELQETRHKCWWGHWTVSKRSKL